MQAINETFTFLTQFPGALVYHLVIVTVLIIFWLKSRRLQKELRSIETKDSCVFACIILILQFFSLVVNVLTWINNPLVAFLQPILFRLLNGLTLVGIICVLIGNFEGKWKKIVPIVIASSMIVFSIIEIVISRGQPITALFNGTWQDIVWHIITLLLCLATMLALLLLKSLNNLEAYILLALASLGCVFSLIFPNRGNLPAWVMLSQILYYPLLLSLLPKFLISPNEQSTYKDKSSATLAEKKVDITPRLISAMLEVSLQNTNKKIQNALSQAISLYMMADICIILHCEPETSQIRFESAYDLIRQDFLKNFTLSEEHLPNLFQAFQDRKALILSKKEQPTDLNSLYQAIGYNQLGSSVFLPIKYNGKAVTRGFLFLSPFTNRQWQPEHLEKLEQIFPTLNRLFDYASEVDGHTTALDTLQVSLNQSNRENQKLQQQLEHSQQLLSELRTEFNNSKNTHQSETNLWIERQSKLEQNLLSLENQISESVREINEAKKIKKENQKLLSQLDKANVQNLRLSLAMQQAKSFLEGISLGKTSEEVIVNEKAKDNVPLEIKKPLPAKNIEQLPDQWLNTILGQYSNQITTKDIKIETNVKIDPTDLPSDVAPIENILKGLVSNALHASPNQGQVEIKIYNGQTEQGQSAILLEVSDSGGGLSLQEQKSFINLIDRIGQPVPGGVGDITAIREVLDTLKNNGGSIFIQSDINKPTTYKAIIPTLHKHEEKGKMKESVQNDKGENS